VAVSLSTILSRRSVRRYEAHSLDDGHLREIRTLVSRESAVGPFGVEPRFTLVTARQMSSVGRVGTYGVIRDAPAFVIGAVKQGAGALEDFGFRMEGIVLELTALGLGTCWMAGTFSRSAAARLLPLRDDEVIPAVTPVGLPSDRSHLVGSIFKLAAGASRRLPFQDLFFRESFDTALTPEAAGPWRDVLECVRRAPSAVNRQPWRIVLERRTGGDRLHLYQATGRFRGSQDAGHMHDIDMGIAMRHVSEAAPACGFAGEWRRLTESPVSDDPAGAGEYVPVTYVATWM
jgi:nitroreductase